MADDGDLYTVGEVARVDGHFTNDAGVDTDPSSLVFRVQRFPAGEVDTYVYGVDSAVVKDATGRFHADVPVTVQADWQWRWIATGVVATAGEGAFRSWSQFDANPNALYTYDLSTDVGKVRLLTDDRDLSAIHGSLPLEERSAIWNDTELQSFIDDTGHPMLAAARALTVLANNRNLIVQSRRFGDTTVDYGAIRGDLLRQAEALRKEYESALGSAFAPADGIAEIGWNDFARRRIMGNAIERTSW